MDMTRRLNKAMSLMMGYELEQEIPMTEDLKQGTPTDADYKISQSLENQTSNPQTQEQTRTHRGDI